MHSDTTQIDKPLTLISHKFFPFHLKIEQFFRVIIHKSIKFCVKKKIIQKNTTIKVLNTFNLAPWFLRHCFASQPSHCADGH